MNVITTDLDGNGQADVVVNFGPPYGLWVLMNNQSWVKLHELSPVSITTTRLDDNAKQDLVIDFGPSYGIWEWMNNQSWMKLHDLSAKQIVASPDSLL